MGADWIFWLVPIVAVVLLIIGGVMRGMAQAQEEQQKQQERKKRPPLPPRPAGAPVPPRPAASGGNELDRFLQEVQRRKRGAEPRPAEPIPVAQPVEPRPRPAARPPVPPPPPRDPVPVARRPRVEEPSPRPRPRPGRRDDIPTVLPVEEAVPVVEVAEERHTPKWEPRTVRPAEPLAPVKPQTADQAYTTAKPATIAKVPLSPALVQLRDLLRTPQSLRTAVMLREVLGPPRCQRRGHR